MTEHMQAKNRCLRFSVLRTYKFFFNARIATNLPISMPC